MTYIRFKNVEIDIPVYNADGRSLKSKLIKTATGGSLGKNENGKVSVKALNNISFSFEDGERVGLLGHNGAGKSTLLRALSGAYKPTSGTVERSGSIGSLIDISLGIDPEATGRENIYLRAALLGLRKKEVDQVVDDIIDFTELGEFIDMPLRTYSTGMQLRLAFAVSTVVNHDILLMDEWLSVGDEGFKNKAEQRLNEIVESTRILIIASHSREMILKTCNRVIWLEHGSVKMDGTPDDVCFHYFGC